MTKERLKELLNENNMSDMCFLDNNTFVKKNDTCGVYKTGLFYYLYLVYSNGEVDILRKSKNPEPFYDFCANYLNINPATSRKKEKSMKTVTQDNAYIYYLKSCYTKDFDMNFIYYMINVLSKGKHSEDYHFSFTIGDTRVDYNYVSNGKKTIIDCKNNDLGLSITTTDDFEEYIRYEKDDTFKLFIEKKEDSYLLETSASSEGIKLKKN